MKLIATPKEEGPELEAWRELLKSLMLVSQFEAEVSCISAHEKGMTPIERIVFFALKSREYWEGMKIHTQYKVAGYRADFMVEWGFNRPEKIIVECDGRAFHEKTKEQAQHDKHRDRLLQANGYRVYRFTGSEIWKTAGQCVLEALEIQVTTA